MESDSAQTVVIDASADDADDLRATLLQALCAANPQHYGIGQVTLYTASSDSTDWPEADWLSIRYLKGKHTSAPQRTTITSRQDMERHLQEQPSTVLLSLNASTVEHPQSLILVSDFVASTLIEDDESANILQRLKNKATAHSQWQKLQHARAVIGFSCFTIARLSTLNRSATQKISVVPIGVAPEFFYPKPQHQLIDNLNINAPFVWLTAVTHDSVDATLATIRAIEALRNFGGFIELKILMSDKINGHDLNKEAKRRILKAVKMHSFIELISDSDNTVLAKHYQQSDGFIWGPCSDRNHQFLLYAMASGLPIIAARSEMIKKHLGANIRFFAADDADDLASTLERSIADIHFRIVGGARNHKRAMAYTWEKTAAELFRLVRAYGATPGDSDALAS